MADRVMRVGRRVGRTLYLTPKENPSGDGTLVGLMDSPELAEAVAAAWNYAYIIKKGDIPDDDSG